jgi:FAD dependent oxidoreductase TIGR03364
VYVASNEEEMTLLEELAQINRDNDYESNLLTRAACLEQYSGLRGDYAIGGLFFPQEVTVDPLQAIHLITGLLQEQYGLTYHTNTLVTAIEKSVDQFQLINNQKLALTAKQVIICSGSDFQTLFPEIFRESDLQSVKLQMLMTRPQPNQRIPGSVLTGWTIRRYESFQDCPSYAGIKAREDAEAYHRKWGIHILFKQADDGRVILGDSHEYLDASGEQQFDYQLHDEVNTYMLKAAQEIYNLQTYEIEKSWYGIYSQCKTQDIFEREVLPGLHIVTGIGGKGMTGSFGFAKQKISSIL